MKVFSQLEKAQLENTTSDTGSLPKGMITYRTDLNIAKVSNGTIMKEMIDADSAQTLSTKTLTSPTINSGTLNTPTIDVMTLDGQGSTPATPASGFYKGYVKDATGKFTILDSAGTETTVGSGSGGGINYISNSDAETATTGWGTYADAAGSVPVNGVSGSPNSTFTRSTSSPLRGSASFLFTKNSGASRQGEGFSYDFTIDAADKGKVLQGSFEYAIASGTFVDDAMEVFIFDVTNSALIYCSPSKLKNHSLPSEKFPFEFQASGSTSYRLIVHVGVTTDSANTLKFDNFSVGPAAKLYGSPVTDWKQVTVTGTWVTNTTYTAYEKQIGDEMMYRIKVAVAGGAPTSTNLIVTLNRTIDTTKLNSAPGSTNQNVGTGMVLDSGANNHPTGVWVLSSTAVSPCVLVASSTYAAGAFISDTVPMTFTSGDEVYMQFTVPIVGLSSSVIMSSDADTRVVAASARRASSGFAVGTAATKVQWNNTVSDTHSGLDTTTNHRYTVQVSGRYQFSGAISFAGVASFTNYNILLYKNGNSVKTQVGIGSATVSSGSAFSFDENAVAGDYFEIYVSTSGAAATVLSDASITGGSTWDIKKISGPAQIAASEKIIAAVEGNPASATSGNVIIAPTATFDTHGGYNTTTGRYTCPANGYYRVAGYIGADVPAISITLHKDTVAGPVLGTTIPTYFTTNLYGTVYCLAGQVLDIRPNGTINCDANSKWVFERL